MTTVNYKVGSYIRLSRDESYSNSDSIDNQKELLETAIMNNWKSVYPIKKGAKDSEQSDYGNNKRNGDEYSFLG